MEEEFNIKSGTEYLPVNRLRLLSFVGDKSIADTIKRETCVEFSGYSLEDVKLFIQFVENKKYPFENETDIDHLIEVFNIYTSLNGNKYGDPFSFFVRHFSEDDLSGNIETISSKFLQFAQKYDLDLSSFINSLTEDSFVKLKNEFKSEKQNMNIREEYLYQLGNTDARVIYIVNRVAAQLLPEKSREKICSLNFLDHLEGSDKRFYEELLSQGEEKKGITLKDGKTKLFIDPSLSKVIKSFSSIQTAVVFYLIYKNESYKWVSYLDIDKYLELRRFIKKFNEDTDNKVELSLKNVEDQMWVNYISKFLSTKRKNKLEEKLN